MKQGKKTRKRGKVAGEVPAAQLRVKDKVSKLERNAMKEKRGVALDLSPKGAGGYKVKAGAKLPSVRAFREEFGDGIPKSVELAHIAAVLAGGRAVRDGDLADRLAGDAVRLWVACATERDWHIYGLMDLESQREDALRDAYGPPDTGLVPRAARFPVCFDDFLLLVVQSPSKAGREHIFLDFVREKVRLERCRLKALKELRLAWAGNRPDHVVQIFDREPLPDVADEDVVRRMEQHRQTQLEERAYVSLAKEFLVWVQERSSEDGRKAARARSGAEEREKLLRGLLRRNEPGGKKA